MGERGARLGLMLLAGGGGGGAAIIRALGGLGIDERQVFSFACRYPLLTKTRHSIDR